MTNRRRLLQALVSTGVAAPFSPTATQPSDPWTDADAIVARIVRPQFPARDFVITDFGAAASW